LFIFPDEGKNTFNIIEYYIIKKIVSSEAILILPFFDPRLLLADYKELTGDVAESNKTLMTS
jgi:hypothetical protein